MQYLLGGILIIFPGILFIGQVISSLNFSLAQKLGLQEAPEETDSLVQTAERYTAYWDLVTMVWMPVSGLLMVMNHSTWPFVSIIAGAIYVDTAGREAAKILSFKHAGLRVGPPRQHRFFLSTYLIMAILGIVAIAYALMKMMPST